MKVILKEIAELLGMKTQRANLGRIDILKS